jgi:hypothetical protein
MAWSSTAPAALAGLVTLFRRIDLNGEVRDGPETGDAAALEVVTVGYIGPDDDAAVENVSVSTGQAGLDRENYDVHCACAVLSGDEDEGVTEVRDRAFELLAACGQLIAADPKLAGAVMQSRISSWSLREDMTTGGPFARIRFDVSVDAFANR